MLFHVAKVILFSETLPFVVGILVSLPQEKSVEPFNAPIEVYDNKFYRYADRDYSISDNPLNADDYELVEKAVTLINEIPEDKTLAELKAVLSKLKGKLMFVL